jgi:signal transduction histidine kinase
MKPPDLSGEATVSRLPLPRGVSGPTSSRPTSLASRLLGLVLAGLVALTFWADREVISATLTTRWPDLLFWGALIVFINLIHIDLEPIQFTLDMPVLLAVALLYPPSVAALVAFASSLDVREFRGVVTISRAIFNRSQIAISVLVSGLTYGAISGSDPVWPRAILGTAGAMGVFYFLNTGFVAGYVAATGRGTARGALKRLAIGRPLQYALTYFGYGILGLVLEQLFQRVGIWSVVLFLIPIVVAHLALVRAERLKSLAERLRNRERLLERLSDCIADERRDERVRIAAGLHDDVLQSLIRISQLGFFLKREISPGTQASEDAGELGDISDETISVLREVVGDLRKSPVGRGGLVSTLQGMARDLQIQSRVDIVVEGPRELRWPADWQLAAYHVAKEGILNALKHARASAIKVTVHETEDSLSMEIVDDGSGFDPEAVDESSHFGLGLSRERIQRLGGSFSIQTRHGSGTRIAVRLPERAGISGGPG